MHKFALEASLFGFFDMESGTGGISKEWPLPYPYTEDWSSFSLPVARLSGETSGVSVTPSRSSCQTPAVVQSVLVCLNHFMTDFDSPFSKANQLHPTLGLPVSVTLSIILTVVHDLSQLLC